MSPPSGDGKLGWATAARWLGLGEGRSARKQTRDLHRHAKSWFPGTVKLQMRHRHREGL